ncbi:pentatricopeptide repeat-containing protein At4g36680, mitochondrial [Pistacia vera]|uniref:pentatricopeptide repeat-containing protein At4g36680, mitochondrial n=1 Tax=Pistacia vera TaxID=55513 RepID=UPI0012635A79|nr:pentatricopeptide repeat-containing protein At4g36680, mitochondrial [Pistacia vera]
MSSNFCHLRRFMSSKSSMSISQAKSRLRSEYDPDKALEIYSSVSKHYSSPVSSRYAQDLTVRRLAKSRRFDDIENLLESHKQDPKITQEPFLSTLIRSYGQAGMFDHAMRTFEQMEHLGTPRSVISFNALLFACNQSKLFDKLPVLFDDIPRKYNFSPDKISYGILVKSYCQAGFPDKALELLQELENKDIEVTGVTYTTVLSSLYKQGKSEEAERLWSEMLTKGCELDVAAYNVRIMNVHGGDPEKLKELIDAEMSNVGLKPDTICYNYLMTCYCKNGMMEEAKKVYKGLEGNGCKPNASTFRTLIYYLCKSEDYEKGYKVFKESVRMHKIPDFNTTRLLVEGLVKKKKMKEAKGISRTVKKKFPPNVLREWQKFEEELGLVSAVTVPEDQEATE